MKYSKEIKAGLIAVLAVVGFVFLFQFMKGKNIFSTDNIYYAKFDNVQGLEPSSPVSINGLKVGQVDAITPIKNASGKFYFLVEVAVNDEYQFSKKSTFEIFEPGIMSDKEIRINLGEGEPYAKDGDTLASSFKPSMMNSLSSQVAPVKDQLQIVLKRVDSLTNNANKVFDEQNRAELAALLRNLNETVASFESTSKQTNALLNNNDPKIQKVLDNASLATESAKSAIDKYGKVAENIDTEKLNATIEKLSATTDNLNKIISGIQNGEGSLGKLTKDDELYKNLQELTTDEKVFRKKRIQPRA